MNEMQTFDNLAAQLAELGFTDVVLVATRPGSRSGGLVRHTVTPERAFTMLEDAAALAAEQLEALPVPAALTRALGRQL